MNFSTHTPRRALTIASLLAAAALAGCQGHGKHTTEFKEQAETRVSQMKAATQWDMAMQQFLAGDLEKALRSITNSINLNDKVAKSHLLKGRILVEIGRPEASLDSFDAALEIDDTYHEAHYYKGIVYERFSQYDTALECYTAASEADPSNPQYIVAAAEMLIDQGDLDEAEALLNKNARSFRHNAGIRQTLGHIAMMRQDHAKAVTYFSEASLLAPDDDSILEDLARAQFEAGRFADADGSLRRILSRDTDDQRRDLKRLRANCLVRLDKPVEAREILTSLASSSSTGAGDADIWIDLAEIAITLKDNHRLREAAQRVISLNPDRPDGYTLMALWQRQGGKLEDAEKTLVKAIALSPSDPSAAILRAVILSDLGRHDQAALSLKAALAIAPEHPEASRMLRTLQMQQTDSALAGATVEE